MLLVDSFASFIPLYSPPLFLLLALPLPLAALFQLLLEQWSLLLLSLLCSLVRPQCSPTHTPAFLPFLVTATLRLLSQTCRKVRRTSLFPQASSRRRLLSALACKIILARMLVLTRTSSPYIFRIFLSDPLPPLFRSAGAVATLFDISCICGTSQYSTIARTAYDIWNAVPSSKISNVVGTFVKKNFPVFADHYFTTSPSGTGISPVFDARATSRKGDPNAFVLVAKAGGLPAPTGSQDVDWLQLSNVQGSLAKTVLRIDTQRGQPPSSVRSLLYELD